MNCISLLLDLIKYESCSKFYDDRELRKFPIDQKSSSTITLNNFIDYSTTSKESLLSMLEMLFNYLKRSSFRFSTLNSDDSSIIRSKNSILQELHSKRLTIFVDYFQKLSLTKYSSNDSIADNNIDFEVLNTFTSKLFNISLHEVLSRESLTILAKVECNLIMSADDDQNVIDSDEQETNLSVWNTHKLKYSDILNHWKRLNKCFRTSYFRMSMRYEYL